MVESVKSLTKNIDVSKNSSSNIDKVDKLNVSSVSQKPDFTKKPPIDMESVSRIKEAIAKGEYPIDLDAVADMLLDAFKEMKS